MLYSPKAPSLESFAAWLETKEGTYAWDSLLECACSQYADDRGVWKGWSKYREKLTAFDEGVLEGVDADWGTLDMLALRGEWTFGALRERVVKEMVSRET